MARIPPTRFGNQVAEPAGTGNVVVRAPDVSVPMAAFDGGLGAQVSRAGNILAVQGASELAEDRRKREAEEERARREAEAQARRDAEQARRNKAAAAFAQYQVTTDTTTDALLEQLGSGEISRAQFAQAHQKALAEAKKAHLAGLDPESQAALQDNLILTDGRLQGRVREGIRKSARDERVAGFNGTIEALSRLALTDPTRAIAQADLAFAGEGRALLGEEGARKAANAFRESASATYFTDQLNAAKGSWRGLQALSKRIDADPFLDPAKKVALNGHIQNQLATMEARAEVAERRRLSAAEHGIKSLMDSTERGFSPRPEEVSSVERLVKGTPYEAGFKTWQKTDAFVREFKSAPPAAMQAKIDELTAQMAKGGASKDTIAFRDSLQRLKNESEKELKDDPLGYAERRGLAEVAPLNLLDSSEAQGSAMAQRINLADTIAARYGVAPKYLKPEEAQMIGEALKRAGPQEKKAILGKLGEIVPAAKMPTLMGELAPKDGAAAFVGVAQARGYRTNKGQDIADLVFLGQQSLAATAPDGSKKTPLKMPKEADLQSGFASYTRDLFKGEAMATYRDFVYERSKEVYAALQVGQNVHDGEYDSKYWKAAIDLVTGGIVNHNGERLIMPYGMPYDTFRRQLEQKVTAMPLPAGLSARDLARAPLVPIGDGRYAFRVGQTLLRDKDGRRIEVEIK